VTRCVMQTVICQVRRVSHNDSNQYLIGSFLMGTSSLAPSHPKINILYGLDLLTQSRFKIKV